MRKASKWIYSKSVPLTVNKKKESILNKDNLPFILLNCTPKQIIL